MTKKEKIITSHSTYIGGTMKGIPHGKGKKTFKNGDIIEGVWKNGRPTKASKYIFYGTDIKWEYEGELTARGELLPNGKGVLKIISAKNKLFSIESGNFKKHFLDGKGSRTYFLSKSLKKPYYIYIGGFKNGKLHGKGYESRYIGSKEGSIKHEGTFKNDKFVKGKTTKF